MSEKRFRVLIEFDESMLKRADQSAKLGGTSRSELIRRAVEKMLDGLDADLLKKDLIDGYLANAKLSLSLANEV